MPLDGERANSLRVASFEPSNVDEVLNLIINLLATANSEQMFLFPALTHTRTITGMR